MTSTLAPAGDRTLAPAPRYLPAATRRILELRAEDCRWPLGDTQDEDFRFCAAPRKGRSSYCGPHASLARGEPR